MQGWIKLHREIFDTDIWHDVTTFRLFVYLIGKASHQDGLKYKGMELNRGQYIRSYRKLADDLSYKEGRGFKKYSLSTIKSCVKKLVIAERVNVKETELGTLFTIINYKKYQEDEKHFNTINSLDTPNVNRTEHRTPNDGNEYCYDNALSERDTEIPNALTNEVRTNTELTPNEVRTNTEQEQELKNLRIKELSTTSTTTGDDAIIFYQNNFGVISPFEQESILAWIKDMGEQMVLEAMKRAIKRNKKSWGYAERILKDWNRKNITTVEQAEAEEVDFQNQQTIRRINKPQSKEVVPDWFKERKNKSQAPVQLSPEELEKTKKEMDAILSKYQTGGG